MGLSDVAGGIAKGAASGALMGALSNLIDIPVATAVHFSVQIDDMNLGTFTTCEGLGVELVTEEHVEGGNNDMVWQLPVRVKYPNITLSRPVTPLSWVLIQWLSGWAIKPSPKTAVIQALGPWSLDLPSMGPIPGPSVPIPIAAWSLVDVIPVRWTGPNLHPVRPEIAFEKLVLAHHGFMGPDISGALSAVF